MILNVGAALSVTDWQLEATNDVTGLSTASKDNGKFSCAFFWSDAQGREVEDKQASHLAVILRFADATEQDCIAEKELLVNQIQAARDGSFEDLAMFNH
jgi:hypothetical protein